jgi:hypothetical protein
MFNLFKRKTKLHKLKLEPKNKDYEQAILRVQIIIFNG